MKSGIYFIQFQSTTQPGTGGLVVVDGDCAHGGDPSNLYQGRIEGAGAGLQAKIHVSHYRGPVNSVFGPLKNFDLELTGRETGTGFELTGHVVGQPQLKISISGEHKADLMA